MRSTPRNGFTLLEMSIVLVIIALVTGMAVSSGISVVATARLSSTQQKMKVIDDALLAYRTANDRLPCPGDLTLATTNTSYGYEAANPGSCTGGTPAANFTGAGATYTNNTAAEGALPVFTLGLPADMMVDGWGNRFRYVVDINYTKLGYFTSLGVSCNIGAITVNDSTGVARSTSSVYALISHGANAHGAYNKNGTVINAGSVNTNELKNCHCNSSATATTYAPTYVQMQPTLDPSNNLDSFDDVVTYKERWQLQTPWDKAGCMYIYVANLFNNNILKFDSKGNYVTTLVTSGLNSGQVNYPEGMAMDSSGYLWATSTSGGTDKIELFNTSGVWQRTVNSPNTEGSANGQVWNPNDMAFDTNNNLWVTDGYNNRIEEFSYSGTWLQSIGYPTSCETSPNLSGPACVAGVANGQFNSPDGIAVDQSNNVWVVDYNNNRVEKFSNSGTWLLTIPSGCSGSSAPACPVNTSGNGQFWWATAVAVDSGNNIWVCDEYGGRLQEFSTSGTFKAQVPLSQGCSSLTIDSNGNFWTANNNNKIVEYSSSGTLLLSFGTYGTGTGQLNGPDGVAIGSQ